MKVNNFYLTLKRRKAFSLVELFISMIIIAIFTSFITSNITSQSQTAKQEAEKLTAFITDLTRKADRRHMNFTIQFHSDYAYSYFGSDTDNKTYIYDARATPGDSPDKIIIIPGFTLDHNFSKKILTYKSNEDEFSDHGTITITRTRDKTSCDIGIDLDGRIRVGE